MYKFHRESGILFASLLLSLTCRAIPVSGGESQESDPAPQSSFLGANCVQRFESTMINFDPQRERGLIGSKVVFVPNSKVVAGSPFGGGPLSAELETTILNVQVYQTSGDPLHIAYTVQAGDRVVRISVIGVYRDEELQGLRKVISASAH